MNLILHEQPMSVLGYGTRTRALSGIGDIA